MRRRRWARAAAALSCLAIIAVVLQLAAVAEGRSPPRRAHGDAHARPRAHGGNGLPPPPTTTTGASATTTTVHHAVAAGAGVGASVRFDAAVRCESVGRKAASGAGDGGACADAEDDDDKRRIPTGPNPLHNR